MENHDVVTFTPVGHPDVRVQRVGFDLSDPYVEQCWGPVVGPSATLLLRRLPTLWSQQFPAQISHVELSRSLGLGSGTSANSRLSHAMDRVARFGLASWHEPGQSLDVYQRVPALRGHQLRRLPEWTQRAHEQLLDSHLEHLSEREHDGPRASAITSRLDRLQRPHQPSVPAPSVPAPAVER